MAIVAYITWNRNMGFIGPKHASPNEEIVFLVKTREEVDEVLASWTEVPPSGRYIEYYQLVEE